MILKRLASLVVTASAVAVVLAPGAFAVLDAGEGMTGVGATAVLPVQGEPREPIGLVAPPDAFERAVQRHLDASVLPVRGEPRERIFVSPSPTTPVASADDGLDWSAFAAGAGSALGMALLTAVAVFTTRRRAAHS